jgi:hypothetical protein
MIDLEEAERLSWHYAIYPTLSEQIPASKQNAGPPLHRLRLEHLILRFIAIHGYSKSSPLFVHATPCIQIQS